MNRGRAQRQFWAGATGAALWCWSACALVAQSAFWLHARFEWGALLAAPLVVLGFVGTSVGAGVVAARFWSAVPDDESGQWSEAAILLALAPLGYFGAVGFAVGIPLFLLGLAPFGLGLEWGADWWEERGWRHWLGWTNAGERDE